MAKKIYLTDDELNRFVREAQEQFIKETRALKNRKFEDDQFSGVTFNYKMKKVKDDRKVTIKISEKALIKIYALVHTYSTEVEWHGVVERLEIDTFLIKDVLVFPHEVSGSTVISDQVAYEKWLNTLDDDTFNALRFHGHSHVNMGVTPSSVDKTYRKNKINEFGTPSPTSDFFYIFLIFNKKGDISGEVYDLQNNALYSTDELNIVFLEENFGWLTGFLDEAKNMVTERTYSYGGYKPGKYTQTPKSNYKKSVQDDDYPDEGEVDDFGNIYHRY